MFQKTRLRLTLLNSIAFIILIVILSKGIYYYTETHIYREVDESLLGMKFDQRTLRKGEFMIGPGPRQILWGPDQTILEPSLEDNSNLKQSEAELFPTVFETIEDITLDDSVYRSLAFQVETTYGKGTIQFIRNIDSEQGMLSQLMLILLLGGGIGSLLAIVCGYYLAGRALVPIKKAWDNQSQFVSDASHEIRTPLAVIQSKTEILFQSPTATIEEKAVDISIISKEVRRLNKLVTSLLTLARSDSNQIELTKSSFFMDEVLSEIVEQYSDIAAYQGKKMKYESTDRLAFWGDKERIHQLLIILVDNALKFTSNGGEIVLSSSKTANGIFLFVKDNGKGIAQEDLTNIFNRFYQVDKSRNVDEGSGLGLSIAKWIVDKHQGTIKVKSELNVGTSFEIILPRSAKIK